MNPHVVVRADASTSGGSGHLSRQLALAEELFREGLQVTLVGAVNEVPMIVERVGNLGLNHIHCERGKLNSDLILSLQPDFVITDSYEFNSDGLSKIQEEIHVLAVIDGNDCNYKVSGYLDQNLFSKNCNYLNPKLSFSQFQLCGPKYALIRDSISRLRAEYDFKSTPSIPKVTCFIGGTDPNGDIVSLAKRISQSEVPADYLFIADQSFHALLNEVLSNVQFTLMSPTNGLEQILANTDAVICAAGTSVLEMSAIGMPTGYLISASNQEQNRQAIVSFKVGTVMELDEHKENIGLAFRDQLESLLYNGSERNSLHESGRNTVDCLGKMRVTDKILEVILK